MAKRLECFYGPSGEGKSSAALAVAKQIYAESKLGTRVYIGDGSAATYIDSGFVKDEENPEGFIELFDWTGRAHPFAVTERMCSGWWPNEAGVLTPPKAEELAKIGLTVFEGASVMGDYLMGDAEGGLSNRAGKGEKIGPDSPIQFNDDGVKVGGNGMGHYMVGQRRMGTNIERSKCFPGWVIWTAHEQLASDEKSGEKIIGPQIVGQKMTANISRIFQNTLHFTTVMSKRKEKDKFTGQEIDVITPQYRLYTRDHFDADKGVFVKYKAVSRCPKPKMLADFIIGAEMGDNILEFYATLVKAKKLSREEAGAA